MRIVSVIPARMASSRFPGKPMKVISGIPMIGHVFYNATQSLLSPDVYVATCDIVIKDYVKSIGGKVIMTSSTHERASDRTAEALIEIEKQLNETVDIVVMLQGDEPMVSGEMIDLAIKPLLNDPKVMITNLMTQINSKDEFEDSNEIKVVFDKDSNAIYFSRAPIPSDMHSSISLKAYKQVCAIPYRRDFLIAFNKWPQSNLESLESIDMLRIIENGFKIKMVLVAGQIFSVDTQEDLRKVESLMLINNNK